MNSPNTPNSPFKSNAAPVRTAGLQLGQPKTTKKKYGIAIFTVLSVHLVLLGGLLIAGCRPDGADKSAQNNPTNTSLPELTKFDSTVVQVDTNLTAGSTLSNTGGALQLPPVTNITSTTALPPAPSGDNAANQPVDHKIVTGDNFSTLATKYGVTVKAIQAANPGVDSRKLKIDNVIHIPAPTPKAASTPGAGPGTGGGGVTPESPAGDNMYVVKPGDNLGKIARMFHTSVKAIQAVNGLKTTSIQAGKKLRIPAAADGVPGASAPASAGGAAPAPEVMANRQ